jgi:hypothetical protein
MALVTDGQFFLQVKSMSVASLNPMLGFGKTVTVLIWNANFSEGRHFVALLISESYIKMSS